MKYMPSGLVEINGNMARWKESHVPMDRAREISNLTLSPCKKKTYTLLSNSLLVFILEKDYP
jgi:hypothetical protein